MSQARIEMNATILPNGQVLATGGSAQDEQEAYKSLNADLFDTTGGTVSGPVSAGANKFARLYHSNALLLPDATVLLLGGNPARGTYEQNMEIYSPGYLFDATGHPLQRPAITANPGPITYGSAFQVQTPDAADIKSVVLIRPGAPTHAFDMEQRMIELPYSVVSGQLSATAPPNGNIAPPGYYMLFILNSAGVPSVASFVYLPKAAANKAPTASIDSPSSNVTINPGGTVTFAGSGSDSDGTIASYAWTFAGGSPASSSSASTTVTYSTPGSYQASLKVTDNGGLVSTAVTRTITVADFAVSATPSSSSTSQGGSASYTATVTGGSGFSGAVAFSVNGLPAGASPIFNPATVTGSGSTGLMVTTSSTTPAGSYTLTIRGTSGTVTHTATVTLVVSVVGDFSIAATPLSQNVQNGSNGNYAVTITPTPNSGFTSTVSLSVGTLPKFVTASFSSTSITQSGTSTLLLGTKKQTKPGTYTVTVTGTCGTLVHSIDVTMVVQ
jgi:PKD repeat protein